MKLDKVAMVEKMLCGMKIPSRRKNIKNNENIRWLLRNLPIQNSKHPNFEMAMKTLEEAL